MLDTGELPVSSVIMLLYMLYYVIICYYVTFVLFLEGDLTPFSVLRAPEFELGLPITQAIDVYHWAASSCLSSSGSTFAIAGVDIGK